MVQRILFRRKTLLAIIALFTLSNYFSTISYNAFISSLQVKVQNCCTIANDQSFGFFKDIPNQEWEDHYRSRVKTQERHSNGDDPLQRKVNLGYGRDHNSFSSVKDAHLWYQANYDAEFTCLNEVSIGEFKGDFEKYKFDSEYEKTNPFPIKWICDPHRIVDLHLKSENKACIAYFFLEDQQSTQLIHDLEQVVPINCEIHVFSPKWDINEFTDGLHVNGKPNQTFHPYGLESSKTHNPRQNYLTISEIVSYLEHSGRNIDILSINCNGCEWDVYNDILDADKNKITFTQILIELHNAPRHAPDLFMEMRRKGYVIFHKEGNSMGKNQEYSFLRLHPNFFHFI